MNSAAIRRSLVNAARLFGRRRLEIVLPSILTMPARATAGARKKNRKPQNKSLLKKKAGHFRKKKCPAEIQSNFLVAIIVVTMFFVPAFVLAVVFVPATAVPIAVMVPVMVVLETPVRTSPVATVVAALFIVWNDPDRANIRRTRPVAAVPVIVTFHRIPVAVDPRVLVFIFGIGAWRANG